MNRQQKEVLISNLQKMMSDAQATFLVNYQGMPVPVLQSLRRNLRKEGSNLKVAKATLMRLAAKNIEGSDTFAESFKNQVGLVFVKNDVSSAAKQLTTFAKEHEALKIIAGFYETRVLSKQELEFLASLPSREVLIAQLLGTMQAPMTNFTRILYLLIARLVIVLKQIEEQKGGKQ